MIKCLIARCSINLEGGVPSMRRMTLAGVFIFLLAVVSCSDHGSSNPVNPELDTTPPFTKSLELLQPGHTMLGYFSVTYNSGSGELAAVPLRSTQWHLNALIFLEAYTGGNAIKFTGTHLDGNILSTDISLTNPFPGIPYFCGFDMKGLVIGPADVTDRTHHSRRWAGGPDGLRLINADGWTRWWNPSEFPFNGTIFSYKDTQFGTPNATEYLNATLLGYKVFATGLGVNAPLSHLLMVPPDHPNGRAVLHAGAMSTRHYELAFPLTETGELDFRFNFAIDVSHGLPDGWQDGQPVEVPGGFPADANQLEPFVLDVQIPTNTVYLSPEGCTGGELELDIRVSDWQALIDGTPIFDEIQSIELTSPTLFQGKRTPVFLSDWSEEQPWATFKIKLDGLSPPAVEDQQILITIVSSEGDYQPYVTSYTGSDPLSTFYVVPVTVKTPLPGGQPGFVLNPLSPWPKPGGTIYNTNFADTTGPVDPKIGWLVTGISGNFMPIIDPEQRIYTARQLDQGGIELLIYDRHGQLAAALDLADFHPAGDPIMVGCSILWADTQGDVYRIYEDGSIGLFFEAATGSGPNAYGRLNIDTNGHGFSQGSTGIQVFNQYGNINWVNFGIGSDQSMFIGPITITITNKVLIGELNMSDGPPGVFKFWALDTYTGQIAWAHEQDISNGLPFCSIADPVSGNIYYTVKNRVIALNSDGSERWQFEADKYLIPELAVSHLSGTLYAAETSLGGVGEYSSLIALSSFGGPIWEFECQAGIAAGPIVDANGKIYIALDEGIVISINPDGETAWIRDIGGQPDYLIFGPEGSLLLGIKEGLFNTTLICLEDN